MTSTEVWNLILSSAHHFLINLSRFLSSLQLKYTIMTIPRSGSLYQLSQVYSSYGYEPKSGKLINENGTLVTGSNNRIVYERPVYDKANNNKVRIFLFPSSRLLFSFHERTYYEVRLICWPSLDFYLWYLSLQWDEFTFSVNNGKHESQVNTITLVPLCGAIVGDDFLFDNNDWYISGNKETNEKSKHEYYSLDKYLNHYIYSTDNKININTDFNYDANDKVNRNSNSNSNNYDNNIDHSLWYFQAPLKYLGNLGMSYKGTLKFTLGSFSGNFSQTNGRDVRSKKVSFYCFQRLHEIFMQYLWKIIIKSTSIYIPNSFTLYPYCPSTSHPGQLCIFF